MRITEFVSVDRIVADVGRGGRDAVLRRMVESLAAAGDVRSIDAAVDALLARERLGSTGIGEGVALPHAKVGGIEGLSIAFGRSREGVDFGSVDGLPVNLLFVILAPEHSGGMHLRALAKISRILRDEGFRGRLMAAEGAEGIHRLLTEADEAF